MAGLCGRQSEDSMRTSEISRRKVLAAFLGIPIAQRLGLALHVPNLKDAGSASYQESYDRLGTKRIRSFCVDFNWAKDGRFAAPGQWADADPEAHVDWYHAAGVNTVQTFCVSCNGYAWYKGGQIPAQPNLKHNFLRDVAQQGHDRGQQVMGYFCVGANTRWQKIHPEESYGAGSCTPNIVFTKRYLDCLEIAITEALNATSIDGFMID
jgi:hypothetical protein